MPASAPAGGARQLESNRRSARPGEQGRRPGEQGAGGSIAPDLGGL
ncbi:MAG: hypothetical protein JOZ98_20555 [Solirubrobacterales bacterium]|nr:hypothetical protein [Solirubrobacterales bacterium]MBV9425311.1 hypothetical protein [Solirubrobacterales bacterium]MBV9800291.1 hypothetical protein [Solirubrobacterales bacterium]